MDGQQERLVVSEQASDGAVALQLEPPDEVDRADPVGPAVDEVADEPDAGVPADPGSPLSSSSAVAQERDQDVAMAVDVAHDEHAVDATADGRGREGALRRLDDASQGADELERLAVGDEPFELARAPPRASRRRPAAG